MPKKNLTTFYIVRHGQTDWNVKRVYQGHTDIPLNKTGETQAKELRNKFKNIKFDLVFSSDLLRAKRTAEIISLEHKLALQTTDKLRERMYGKLEGQPYEMRENIYRILENLTDEERINVKLTPETETDKELITRLLTFLREIAVANLGKNVLVVTHGGPIHAILRHLGLYSYKKRASIANTAYIKLSSDGVDFFLEETAGIKNLNE